MCPELGQLAGHEVHLLFQITDLAAQLPVTLFARLQVGLGLAQLLPKMAGVLLIAVLLRFMDSFMIYTEPFVVTGGGPGNSTTFLSIDLVKMAIGQFDLGPAAAFSIMYFLVILLVSWVFYTVMTNLDKEEGK